MIRVRETGWVSRNSAECSRTAKPQRVSALYAKVAQKLTEIELVHAERLRERAHVGEHLADVSHLGGHFGVNDHAHAQHKRNGGAPDKERYSAAA